MHLSVTVLLCGVCVVVEALQSGNPNTVYAAGSHSKVLLVEGQFVVGAGNAYIQHSHSTLRVKTSCLFWLNACTIKIPRVKVVLD